MSIKGGRDLALRNPRRCHTGTGRPRVGRAAPRERRTQSRGGPYLRTGSALLIDDHAGSKAMSDGLLHDPEDTARWLFNRTPNGAQLRTAIIPHSIPPFVCPGPGSPDPAVGVRVSDGPFPTSGVKM